MLDSENSNTTHTEEPQATSPSGSRTYAGVSLAKRKSMRKKQFLEAGLRLFGCCGFRSATVRGICKEAKLTDRYFYESYGNLENLLKAVYESCMTHLSKEILQAIQSGYQDKDAEQAIIAGLDAYFKVLEEPNLAKICMVELEGISPEVNELYYGYIDRFAEILIALAHKAFPHITIPAGEQKIMATALVGAMRQAATNWFVEDYQTPREELVSATSKLFLGMITLLKHQ